MTSRFHLSPVPPHLASRQLGASAHTKGKFSVSGWLKALTLEKTIEENINTTGPGSGTFSLSCPLPIDRDAFPF